MRLLQDAREKLPTELKERLFELFCDRVQSLPPGSSSMAPTTAAAAAPSSGSMLPSYPEDRYRDVQLVNRITCQRVIPLCFAMWSSLDYSFAKVRRLVEDEVCDVNESDLEGFCPLHYSAIYSRIEACRLLLAHGADCTRRNNFGRTAQELAQDPRIKKMIRSEYTHAPLPPPTLLSFLV
jgi:hypothetical protein